MSLRCLNFALLGIFLGAGITAPTTTAALQSQSPTIRSSPSNEVVAMRRLTESQYRNSIADIFGSDIQVSGRFEPMIRPTYELAATAAAETTISPVGLEQFDEMAREIADQVFDPARRSRFLRCVPPNPSLPDNDCARAALVPLGKRLFRRPLSEQEAMRYARLADEAATATGSFYDGLKLSLAAMLVAPNFLYIIETAQPDPAVPGGLTLDNYARASRLSFLLWDTTPDEMLLEAAAQGRLTTQDQLSVVVRTMIASPRIERGTRAFFTDMLMLESFEDMTKDRVVFPRYNLAMARDLPEQMLRMVVDLLVFRKGDYREIFTTGRTFVNHNLGPLYGLSVEPARGWVSHEFGSSDDRSGILGHAGFLAVGAAQVGRSSPTLRGRAIRELLLCQPIPDPPGNVNFDLFERADDKARPTARMRLAAHNDNPICAGCHNDTDPMGLTLEKFDGMGAFRATENGARIDTSGVFAGVKYSGPVGLGRVLAANKATTRCVARRVFDYATGRTNKDIDPLVSMLEAGFAAAGYRWPALILHVATMPEAYRVPVAPGGSLTLRRRPKDSEEGPAAGRGSDHA